MLRPFQFLNQRGNLAMMAIQQGADPEWKRLHGKWLFCVRPGGSGQPKPKQAIDSSLEGIAGAANLLIQELRHVVVNGERGAHIKMLERSHHDVNHDPGPRPRTVPHWELPLPNSRC